MLIPGGGGGWVIPPAEDMNEIEGYTPIDIDVVDMTTLGDSLFAEADNVDAIYDHLDKQLADSAGRTGAGERPFGRDSRFETVHPVADFHSRSTVQAMEYLDEVRKGLRALGAMAWTVVNEFQDQDGMNAADTERVREIFEMEVNPNPPAPGGGSHGPIAV